jgi:hypothetical protein
MIAILGIVYCLGAYLVFIKFRLLIIGSTYSGKWLSELLASSDCRPFSTV